MKKAIRKQGNTSTSAAMVVALVGAAGVGSFVHLGGTAEQAIIGTTAVAVSETPSVGSRQSAAIWSSLTDLVKVLKRPAAVDLKVALTDVDKAYVRNASEAANKGNVLGTRRALSELRSSVADEVFESREFAGLEEQLVAIAFGKSSRAAKLANEGAVRIFRELIEADPELRRLVDAVDLDADKLIENVGPAPTGFMDGRRAWRLLTASRGKRPLLMRAIDDDAREFTRGLWSALDDAPDENKAWDVLHVGAGITTAHSASVISDANPSVKQLVIEASDSAASGNFLAGGDAFAYNMTNRRYIYGAETGPGKTANLAPIRSVINPADLSGLKYAEAKTWAEAGAIALRTSGADVAVSTRVSKIERADVGSPAKYRVTLSQSVDGVEQTREVYANKVAIGAGVGRPKFPGLDTDSLQIVNEELAKFDIDDPNSVPLVTTARNELAMAATYPEWWDQYVVDEGRPELRDAVVGLGDSSFTHLEERFRLGFQLDDRRVAQRGVIQGVDYYVTERGPRTADEFLTGRADSEKWNGVRTRYGDIFTAIKKAFTSKQAGEAPGPESINLVASKVARIRRNPADRSLQVTDATGNTQNYRRLVLSTGYESLVGDLLDSFVPKSSYSGDIQRSGKLDVIDTNGRVIDAGQVGQDVTAVARKVPDEDIYIQGVAAGLDIPVADELAGVTENNAAFFNWGPRIEDLALGQFIDAAGFEPVRPTAAEAQTVARNLDKSDISVDFGSWDGLARLTRRDELAYGDDLSLAMRYELARAYRDVALDGDSPFALSFERRDGLLVVNSTHDLPDRLVDELDNATRFQGLVRELVRRDRPLTFVGDVRSNARSGLPKGALRLGSLESL